MKTQPVSSEFMARAMERFRAQLLAQGMKLSKERTSVALCALQHSGEFCAQDVVLELRNAGLPGGHQSTVYRAIRVLLEAGLVRATHGKHRESQRYEVIFEREPQPFLRCASCGTSVGFPSQALSALKREAVQRCGFTLDIGASQLAGVCTNCRRVASV